MSSASKAAFRKVVRARRSPMNAGIWWVRLECGHEAWVTQKSCPARARCYEAHE